PSIHRIPTPMCPLTWRGVRPAGATGGSAIVVDDFGRVGLVGFAVNTLGRAGLGLAGVVFGIAPILDVLGLAAQFFLGQLEALGNSATGFLDDALRFSTFFFPVTFVRHVVPVI